MRSVDICDCVMNGRILLRRKKFNKIEEKNPQRKLEINTRGYESKWEVEQQETHKIIEGNGGWLASIHTTRCSIYYIAAVVSCSGVIFGEMVFIMVPWSVAWEHRGGAAVFAQRGVASVRRRRAGRMLPTFDIITTDSALEPRDYKDNITAAGDLLAINFTYIHHREKMCACASLYARASMCVCERERGTKVFLSLKLLLEPWNGIDFCFFFFFVVFIPRAVTNCTCTVIIPYMYADKFLKRAFFPQPFTYSYADQYHKVSLVKLFVGMHSQWNAWNDTRAGGVCV